jgi:hypothetical protein
MRGSELAVAAKFDIVVPIESLRARLANAAETEAGFVVTMPLQSPSVRWKIPLPPQTGWESLGKVGASELATVVREGMKIIKRKIPRNAEEYLVRSYRSQVWGSTINNSLGMPAGVALAAETLGFFGDTVMSVSEKNPWIRLSSTRGEVLAKMTPAVLELG